MMLNTVLLAGELPFPLECQRCGNPVRRTLQYAALWHSGSPLLPNCLYILDAEQLLGLNPPEGISLLSIGLPPDADTCLPGADLLCVPSYFSPETVLAAVTDIFCRYQLCEGRLRDFARTGGGWAELDKLLQDLFGMPVIVLGEFRQVLLVSKQARRLCRSDEPSDFLPEALEQSLYAGACDKYGFRSGQTPERLPYLFYRIPLPDRYGGETCLVLLDFNRNLNDGKRILLHQFGPWLVRYRSFLRRSFYDELQQFQLALRRHLLAGNDRPCPSVLLHTRTKIGWEPGDSLVCVVLQSSVAPTAAEDLAKAAHLPDAHTLLIDRARSGFLCNLTRAGITEEALFEKLVHATTAYPFTAGISDAFTEFSRYPAHAQQARAALDMGMRLDCVSRIYRFRDYVCDCLIRRGVFSLPLDAALPQGLQELLAQDRLHKTAYCKTLAAYCRNELHLKATADELDIHTSTLKYRLQRIQAFLQLDLQDPDVRLYLSLVFYRLSHPPREPLDG